MHGHVLHADGTPAVGTTVSCGPLVTRTDDDGRFEFPDDAGRFVVLTRPTGFTAAPWWFRAGTDLEFRLVEEPQELPYEFLHVTDTHMTVPGDGTDEGHGLYAEGALPQQIKNFLATMGDHSPAARSIVVTGDLVDHGTADEYEAYVDAMSTSPVPVHLIPGNHDHMGGTHGSVVSRNNYLTNTGTVDLYEQFLGPRWYSLDLAGLHVVAMDWHSHELGLDHETQDAWLRNDLAQLEPGAPWILLFHDQPNASVLDGLPWQPIAAFSGHWHTSRVVEVDGTLHVNSPTSFFASLDYSPPGFRHVTWDGEQISLRTQTLLERAVPEALADVSTSTFAAGGGSSTGRWTARLTGAGHRAAVAVGAGAVFAGSQVEDRAAGSVEAFDLTTGEPRWCTTTNSSIKTTPAFADVDGGIVVAAEVSGDLIALDAHTGDLRWRLASSDPLRRFGWGAPTVVPDGEEARVFLGDPSDLRCVDVRTGEVVWRRTDLSPHHNLVNHAAPLVVGDLLVMGFWPTPLHPVGLDARTGEPVWETAAPGDDPFFMLKRLLIMGTATFDAERDAVLMPAFGHTTSVDRATGARNWAAPHEGGFSPSSPVFTPAGYVVTVTGRGLRMVDPDTGSTIWDTVVEGDAPFPMGSYTKAPHPVLAPPTLVGEHLLLPGLDGTVRRFTLAGEQIGRAQFDTPFAAALVSVDQAGEVVLAAGTDGSVRCLDAS